jgi:hypothetical protein
MNLNPKITKINELEIISITEYTNTNRVKVKANIGKLRLTITGEKQDITGD